MNKNKFNVGDRVCFNDRCVNYDSEVIVGSGDMGTITDIPVGGYVTVELDSPEYITVQERDIQIVEPYNRKNAFLSELKGLLEKYGAVINASWNDGWQADDAKCPRIDVDICLGNGEYIDFDDVLTYSLTTDNIMGYDKK